jgi:GxxExxY protein
MVDLTQYDDITGKIIGGAMRVHSVLGNGFQEVIYQRALEIELQECGLTFKREQEIPVHYKDKEIGSRRADFLVEDSVLVELKAITQIDEVHHAQIINYLTAYKLEVRLLINFGEKKLWFKRFVKSYKSV